mmetsp:Transcript_15067/g.34797  ORF Transcript_15067/g.34797 Transcript_15067/m.34797 type:complete len:121 (+) Transcript_15067:814-1176(+)|eukprot:CAMPEP_0116833032 /NCGR_PEP_ID=MMETSP0418-20121206/6214_1 /TAXON_ID=1158023 /ORGANISM="Astrosyne radiata, Strain 13vi08-1A" /LENGTH=120 /DNA_ID=CAMNT_0004462443 /DNA_START=95 /DNA_END=457 /DNA_ORIENTATION=+
MILFPELHHGADIQIVAPSKGKKSWRRVNNEKATEFEPLTPLKMDMWVDRMIDNKIRANLTAVALASMQKMPALLMKIHEAETRKNAWFLRQKQIATTARANTSWQECQREIMRSFLYTQ